nr:MAG TPA: hypothetical protein [Caudoviricetes sp.]
MKRGCPRGSFENTPSGAFLCLKSRQNITQNLTLDFKWVWGNVDSGLCCGVSTPARSKLRKSALLTPCFIGSNFAF